MTQAGRSPATAGGEDNRAEPLVDRAEDFFAGADPGERSQRLVQSGDHQTARHRAHPGGITAFQVITTGDRRRTGTEVVHGSSVGPRSHATPAARGRCVLMQTWTWWPCATGGTLALADLEVKLRVVVVDGRALAWWVDGATGRAIWRVEPGGA